MGRPRIYPEGTSATQRVNASVAALKARGGARKTFRLSPEAVQALGEIQARTGEATETAVVERLLLEEARRVG